MATWKKYEELRPDRLAEIVRESPVAYWPLGRLAHHGWHLPVGYGGIKAARTCIRVAERTGGVRHRRCRGRSVPGNKYVSGEVELGMKVSKRILVGGLGDRV